MSKILLLFCLAPMVLSRLTFMFMGSCFLLILSHLEVKVLPFGKFTIVGYALFLKMTVCFIIFCDYYDEHPYLVFFLKTGFAISPRTGAARDAISPKGIAPPFCFLLFVCFFIYFPLCIRLLFELTVFP